MYKQSVKQKKNAGFTLLLATLIATLMASLGAAMFTIARKEVKLSALGRDSQFAFYAADAGAECALYWDYAYDVFNTGTPYKNDGTGHNNATMDQNGTPIVTCDGQPVVPSNATLGGTPNSIFNFDLKLEDPDGNLKKKLCVKVTVEKRNTYPYTSIQSSGYNKSCAFVDTHTSADNTVLLERAVRIQY